MYRFSKILFPFLPLHGFEDAPFSLPLSGQIRSLPFFCYGRYAPLFFFPLPFLHGDDEGSFSLTAVPFSDQD